MWGTVYPELDKNNEIHTKNRRGRPQGRKNSIVRADRQEACRAAAQALIREPEASVARLAALAWPEAQQDEKARKAAHERARRALADLKRATWLVGDAELAERVRKALEAREAAEVAKREERARREQEREERRREREMRFRMQPASKLRRYLLRQKEIREELKKAVRARRFAVVGGEDNRETMHAFALAPEAVTSLPVPHFRTGMAGSTMNSAEATWRADMELRLARQAASLATIPAEEAKHILAIAKELRKARRAGDQTAEARAREKLRRAVQAALDRAGWADPDLPAAQILESQAAREAREAKIVREAGIWPILAHGGVVDLMVDLTGDDQGAKEPRRTGIETEGEETQRDEAAEVASEAAGLILSSLTDPGPGGGRVKHGGSRTDKAALRQMLS